MSGLNAINFYSSTIFGEIFTGNNSVAIVKSLTGVVQLIGVFLAPVLAKLVSLKTTFLIGHGFAAVLFGLVVLFSELAGDERWS